MAGFIFSGGRDACGADQARPGDPSSIALGMAPGTAPGAGAEGGAGESRSPEKTGERVRQEDEGEAAFIRADAAQMADAAQAAVVAATAAQEQAQRLQAEADARAAAAIRAQDLALKQQETARRAVERAIVATAAARRLSGVGGALRGLWDGVRRSSIVARVRAEVAPTLDAWRAAVAAADARAAAAESARRAAEAKTKIIRESAAELGAQRDALRRRLAVYEPLTEPVPVAGPRRP